MLEKETKQNLEKIAENMKQSLAKDSEKFKDKSLLSNPIVIGLAIVLIMAVTMQPSLLLIAAGVFFVVLLFKSNDVKSVGKAAVDIPRDIIKNRKKIKEEAKAAMAQAKEQFSSKKSDTSQDTKDEDKKQ